MTLFGHTIDFNMKRPARPGVRMASSRKKSLFDAPPGSVTTIGNFAPGMSPERWAHLQAYGLTPGRCVRVVQQTPVTVIQVEHCEIALEDDLARLIEID